MTETATTATTTPTKFEGRIENAYGLELDTAIDYTGTYDHVLDFSSIPAKEMPDEKDILAVVNNARKANARQKAMQEALDNAGIKKPTLDNSVDLQVATIVKSLVASGKYDKAGAEKQARTMLGLA